MVGSNWAIFSDKGTGYVDVWKWVALVPNPSEKAPGTLSSERMTLVAHVKGRSMSEMERAGAELARLMAERGGSLQAAEAAATPAVTPQQAQVKTYKSDKDFEKDARKMLRDDWSIQGQSVHQGKVALGRTLGKAVLTGGIGLALSGRSRRDDTITVTWFKGGEAETSQPKAAAATAAAADDKYDQLAKLASLKDKGILTEEEFQTEKSKLLGG